MAKEVIDIVTSKNADSKQTDLPTLVIGIGISYLDERPLFLFDENRPIMISAAIGLKVSIQHPLSRTPDFNFCLREGDRINLNSLVWQVYD